jgi:hypothetical protein
VYVDEVNKAVVSFQAMTFDDGSSRPWNRSVFCNATAMLTNYGKKI